MNFMNNSKFFSQSCHQLIESLKFASFLYDISIFLEIKYQKINSLNFFKISQLVARLSI